MKKYTEEELNRFRDLIKKETGVRPEYMAIRDNGDGTISLLEWNPPFEMNQKVLYIPRTPRTFIEGLSDDSDN